MSSNGRSTRREFLSRAAGTGAAAASAPLILTACVRGTAAQAPPSERVNVGYIGVGRRGCQLFGLPGDTQIVAISDVNAPRMDEVAKHLEEKRGQKDVQKYQNYHDLLARDDIDAVVVATPDHWHALPSIDACKAGKDVYVEKPMTLTIEEGRAMVKAARKHKRIVQVGSQQRSMQECRFGCELVRNGRLGKVSVVHASNYPSPWECDLPEQPVPDGLDWDMWCGQTEPRPYHEELYAPRVRGQEAGWISYRPYSGGEMTGWGAHGLDIIQWALGVDQTGPVEVWLVPGTEGEFDGTHKGPRGHVGMKFANGVTVMLDGKGPGGGGVFEGENGAIMISRGKYEAKPKSIAEPLSDDEIRLYESNNHLGNWVDCIRSREMPVADVEVGHRAATLCHLGNIARWTRRRLKWDPDKERFIGDDEANGYLSRPQRKPYGI